MTNEIINSNFKYHPKKTSIFKTGVLNKNISAMQIDKSPTRPVIIKIRYNNSCIKPLYAIIDLDNLSRYARSLKFRKGKGNYFVRIIIKNEHEERDYLTYEELL